MSDPGHVGTKEPESAHAEPAVGPTRIASARYVPMTPGFFTAWPFVSERGP